MEFEDLTSKSPPLRRRPPPRPALRPRNPSDGPSNSAPIHVDAAAYAALLAIDHGDPGIYNIAHSNRHVATEMSRGAGLDSRFSSSGPTISDGGSAQHALRAASLRNAAPSSRNPAMKSSLQYPDPRMQELWLRWRSRVLCPRWSPKEEIRRRHAVQG